MTDRKQKIINVLDNFKDYIIGGDINDDIADAILALPSDVPSDEEIANKIQVIRKNKLNGYGNMSIGRLQLGELEWSNLVLDICKWMREEIIKRNK